VDWAVSLAELANKIYVVHRRDKFRAAPDMVDKMQALAKTGTIEMVVPYQLEGLEGANGNLSAVIVKNMDGSSRTLAAEHLLAFFGLSMELGPIANWGLGLTGNHIAVARGTMATNVPGIFAIGDIATYDHKLKLILCGFAEAAEAAHAIRDIVYPGVAYHFEYSTTKGVAA
jgi:thioredoxin reductase (NADPH)